MKRTILTIASAALSAVLFILTGCTPELEPLDSPFVYIKDSNGASSMNVDADANNLTTSVYLFTCSRKIEEPFDVSFKVTVGDGLKEGVDFRIKQGLEGAITFQQGIIKMPIHVVWMKNPNFDPEKDNTLRIEITGCTHPDFTIGYLSLGDTHLYRTYTFKRVKID